MEYIYKGITLKPRETNWIKYRIPSIKFKDKYKKFKQQYIDTELEKEIQSKIFANKELALLALYSSDENKIELSSKLFDLYPELSAKYMLQNIEEPTIIESFLIDNDLENTRLLLEFLFDNSNELDYNINTEDEYKEFYKMLNEVFHNFFTP